MGNGPSNGLPGRECLGGRVRAIAILGLLLSGVNATTPAEGEAGTAMDDMAVIRERMLAPLRRAPDLTRVQRWQAELGPDGSWSDVNYAGKSTTSWGL